MSELSRSTSGRAEEFAPAIQDEASGARAPGSAKRPFVVATAVVLAALGVGIARYAWRDYQATVFQRAQAATVPHVRSAKVHRADGPVRLELPGQTLAIEQARLFARATGYVAERRADIGTRVKKGDLLARIAAPDLDQQYAQAKAQLGVANAQLSQALAVVEQMRANLDLAKATHARSAALVKQNFESRQSFDNASASVKAQAANLSAAEAGAEVARANISAQQATVERLKRLTEFESVVAPFDGVVTMRNVEVGDLGAADASGGTPLFQVARDDVLRVQVAVPQAEAIGVVDGLEAEIAAPERPGKTYKGRVSRNASSLDQATRTLLVEVEVANPNRELRPGLFVRAMLDVPRAQPLVTVPGQAIRFGAEGPQVATIENDGVVKLKKIAIVRDFGATVEINEGLSGSETVVLDPPADIRDGAKVSLVR